MNFIFGALGFNYENDSQKWPNETFVVIYKHCDADPFKILFICFLIIQVGN